MEILKEFLLYLKSSKKFIFAPMLIILFLLGLLMVFAEGSILAPFIYTLF